jgi:hypothetical protein
LPLRGLEESPGEAVTVAEVPVVGLPAVLLVLKVVGEGVATADEAAGADVPGAGADPGTHCE